MEEGRKFNTNYPTNKPSSFIHYPLSNKKSGRCLPDFFLCESSRSGVMQVAELFYGLYGVAFAA